MAAQFIKIEKMKNIVTMKNFLIFLSFMFFAAPSFGAGSFPLTATIPAGQNYVRLSWNPTGLPNYAAGRYYYTIQLSEDNGVNWQTCSANYGKPIKVLNVYPDIAESNTLKSWMETGGVNGPGMGLINVTPLDITFFNANPDFYLKNVAGNYQYDVIMFGSWDGNNNRDLNPASAAAVGAFLNSGRGVLFGHDTQETNHPNFASLSNRSNLNIDLLNRRLWLDRGGTTIRAINNGFLLRFPHVIPNNVNLTIPLTHTSGQTAIGIVWMNFPIAAPSSPAVPQIVNGGTNNFYLTTWKNAAMIQTGHSGGQSTVMLIIKRRI